MLKLYLCVIFSLFVTMRAYAENFYSIIDAGQSYPWFLESRQEYLNIHLNYIDENLKLRLLDDVTGVNTYYPSNGDIGQLISSLEPNESKVILSVDGNYVLINKSAVKKVHKKDYNDFLERQKDIFNGVLGFKVNGETNKNVIDALKSENPYFREYEFKDGYDGLSVVLFQYHSKMPVINSLRPSVMKAKFIEGKLYQILFTWEPDSDKLEDIRRFNGVNVHSALMEGLNHKYKRNYLRTQDGDVTKWYFWISNNNFISVAFYRNKNKTELSYYSTPLYDKVLNVISESEIMIEQQKRIEKNKQEMNRKKINSANL